MAKKKSKKIKMVESHEAQTIGFLQRSGVPAGDMKKLINEIHELVEFGGVSIPEAHQEALENWHQRTAFAALKELEKEHKKQTADVAKATERAIAAAKAVTKANEAAARLAAKAEAKAAKDTIKANEAAARLAAKAEAKAAKTAVVTVPPDSIPIPPVAEPAGPTVMPPRRVEPPRQESGIRKALGKSLTKEEQEYQKTLDKLRLDAEKTVQSNEELFGTKYDQTIDQSTAYELYDGVVRLGESAAKARKAEDKQRLLASLNAYKKIVMNLAKEGNDKEKELANKLLDVIASIEKKLSKGSGEIGRLKEKLGDWAQQLPENLAAKIPLVGGFLSGMIQRKRERKEGEEYEKQDILAAASRGTGGTSLFGTYGGRRGGMGGMSESAIEGISTGGTDLGGVDDTMETGTITKPERSTGLGGGETIRTLQSILIQVSDIKSLIQGQTNTEAGTDVIEAEREAADKEQDFLDKLKGLFGGKGGKGKDTISSETSGGGIVGFLEDFMKKGLMGMLAGMVAPIAAIALPVISVIAAAAGGYMVGKMLFDNWLSPIMDEQQAKRNAALAEKPNTETKDITTDTGEKVYAVGDDANNYVMSESEIKTQLADTKIDSKRRADLENALAVGPEKQTRDLTTNTIVGGRKDIVSGQNIDSMRTSEAATEKANAADPKGRAYQELYDNIVRFDETTRSDWEKKSSLDPESIDFPTVIKKYKTQAGPLWKQIDSKANNFSEDQKEKLKSLSPLLNELGVKANLGEIEGAMDIADMNKYVARDKKTTMLGFEVNPGQSEEVKTRLAQMQERDAIPAIDTPNTGTMTPAAAPAAATGTMTPAAAPAAAPATGTLIPAAATGTMAPAAAPVAATGTMAPAAATDTMTPATATGTMTPAAAPAVVTGAVISDQNDIDPDTGENLRQPIPPKTNVVGTIVPKEKSNTEERTKLANVYRGAISELESKIEMAEPKSGWFGGGKGYSDAHKSALEKLKAEAAVIFPEGLDKPEIGTAGQTTTLKSLLNYTRDREVNLEGNARVDGTLKTYAPKTINDNAPESIGGEAAIDTALKGSIAAPSTLNTSVGSSVAQLDKSREGLEDAQSSATQPGTSNNSNTVIAPKTNNTTINNNVGGASTRNNDPTLKSAERGSI